MYKHLTSLLGTACLLSACTVTDTFSPRASTYNIEAQDLGNELLLLNIDRASQRLPLQFTDIQSLTGQNTSSASIGYSTPFVGAPNGASRTLNPSATGTLQTTFTGVALNTQEFYQGVSSPISAVQASYFVRNITPQELSFNLFFSQINIYRGNDECKKKGYFADCALSFSNNPRNIQSSNLFRQTITYLLGLGLTLEDVQLFNRDIEDDKNGLKSLKFKDADRRSVARFCFRPPDDEAVASIIDKTFFCGSANAISMLKKLPDESDQKPSIHLSKDIIEKYKYIISEAKRLQPDLNEATQLQPLRVDADDRSDELTKRLNAFSGETVRIELVLRSTLDIFDYLGALVSVSRRDGRQLGQISGNIDKYTSLPCDIKFVEGCEPIFAMSETMNAETPSLQYDHRHLFLNSKDGRVGYSTISLAILKRVLGLNTSSKSVPAPAIITGTLVQ